MIRSRLVLIIPCILSLAACSSSQSDKIEVDAKLVTPDVVAVENTPLNGDLSVSKHNPVKYSAALNSSKSKNTEPQLTSAFLPENDTDQAFMVLPDTYTQIAKAIRTTGLFSNRAQLEANEHSIEAHKQTLLPQLRPGASVNSDGDLIARINVDQVLFDGGRYSATKNNLISERDSTAARLDVEEGDKIANAISAYIQYHHAVEAKNLSAEISKLFGRLEKQSEIRVANGVGDNSEKDLFHLKKIEADAEYANYNSKAFSSEKKLRTLAGIAMPVTGPKRLNLDKYVQFSPRVRLAAAEMEALSHQVEFEEADRMPRISLNGNVGTATDSFDQEDLDLRVEVAMNQPLTWGVDHSLAARRSELEASRLRYEDTKKEVYDTISILKFDIAKEESSIKQLTKIKTVGKKRLKSFETQFLSGNAGIIEAASIIETYKKSSMNLIDSKFTIHNLELELAVLTGLFNTQ